MISQMKALEDENRLLKKMYAERSRQAELLKEALGKNDTAVSTPRDGRKSSGNLSHFVAPETPLANVLAVPVEKRDQVQDFLPAPHEFDSIIVDLGNT